MIADTLQAIFFMLSFFTLYAIAWLLLFIITIAISSRDADIFITLQLATSYIAADTASFH